MKPKMLSRGEKVDTNWYEAFDAVTQSIDGLQLTFNYSRARVIADWVFRQTNDSMNEKVNLRVYWPGQQKTIRYRINQWIVLNRFYTHKHEILRFTYELENLPATIDNNPFDSADAWNLLKNNFRPLNPRAAKFISPWIIALDATMIDPNAHVEAQ